MYFFPTGSPKSLAGECQGIYVKDIVVRPPNFFCEIGQTNILLSSQGTEDFNCNGAPHGQTKLAWETIARTESGFKDDAYYIHLYQQSTELYKSVEQFWDTPGMARASGIVGVAGTPGYRVQFRCDNFFSQCGGGWFKFRLVDCGCPGGEAPLLPCRADQIAHARNAVSQIVMRNIHY